MSENKKHQILKIKPIILTEAKLLERVRKVAEESSFIVYGFIGEYNGHKSRLDCECLVDGNRWQPTVNNILSKGSRCSVCRDTKLRNDRRLSEKEAFRRCEVICKEMNYTPIGFPDGYNNQKSYFEYKCPVHGKHRVLYNNFVSRGRRCPLCWKDRQKELALGFYGWYPERAEEQDFLYIMNFDNRYIKVGRSFDVDGRIIDLRRESGVYNISKLSVYTATHKEVYYLEQYIHDNLERNGFWYDSYWSTETFVSESLQSIYNIMECCNYDIVFDYRDNSSHDVVSSKS